ncbi:MAG: cyclic nucleotide-binding domain-containing protein, partial [Gammaproteobacteria bacterium]
MNLTAIELPQHYLFDSLDEAQRHEVGAHSRTRQLAASEPLFAQGDPADCFWWLESGQVKLYRLSRDGHQKVMGL